MRGQCAEELSFGEGKVTYLQLLLQSVDPESFSKEVLPLFQDSNSDLVHAKVRQIACTQLQVCVCVWIITINPALTLANPLPAGLLRGTSDAIQQGQSSAG